MLAAPRFIEELDCLTVSTEQREESKVIKPLSPQTLPVVAADDIPRGKGGVKRCPFQRSPLGWLLVGAAVCQQHNGAT